MRGGQVLTRVRASFTGEGRRVSDETKSDDYKPPTWAEMRAKTDHADKAYRDLGMSGVSSDLRDRSIMVRSAHVHATLALQDKLEEFAATIKHCVGQLIDSNSTLNENVKLAAKHLHADAQELKHLRVVPDEEAA